MANNDHINVVIRGVDAIRDWRVANPTTEADLTDASLRGIRFTGLTLEKFTFRGADLSQSSFNKCILTGCDFRRANLHHATFSRSVLNHCDLSGAKLRSANLRDTKFESVCDMTGSDLTSACLARSDFAGARWGFTTVGNVDLSSARNLDCIVHSGPSTLGVDTLKLSQAHIPDTFFRQCGLSAWEVAYARLYDPALSAHEISEIVSTELFSARTDGPLFLGGIFISYARADSLFVDKLYEQFKAVGASCWLDRHDLLAGDLERQVLRSIRLNDVVVLVLSKNSIKSDWVEFELEAARNKEKSEGRDVLCPIAIDGSWEQKVNGSVLWRQLAKKNILDFSAWKTKMFKTQFDKLIRGLKINYTVNP